MNRNFLRTIFTLMAVSSHAFWCVHAAGGSWFDGMEFEDYPPSGQQDDSETGSIKPTSAWRIPCGLIEDGTDPSVASNVLPLSTVIDLNSSTSTIQDSFLQSHFDRDELLSKLMMTQDDQTNGTHVMMIPSGSIWLRMGSTQATVLAPKLEVLVLVTDGRVTKKNANDAHQDDDSIQLRLGLDFLSMYQGRLDVEGAGGLFIVLNHQDDGSTEEEVFIPILQPRSPINHEDL